MGRSSTPAFGPKPSCKLVRNASCTSLTRQLSRRRPGTPVESCPGSPRSLPGCVEETRSKQLAPSQNSQEASGSSEKKSVLKYKEVKLLGKGSFGTVRLVQSDSGTYVALKTVELRQGESCHEAQVLRSLQHPCIVGMLESLETATKRGGVLHHLVLEYLPTTLHSQIHGRPLSLCDCQCYGFQLFRALAHLDALQIAHRDIKPENLLVDKSKALKVADFGSAKSLSGEKPSSNEGYFCSRWWRAPELVLGCKEYGTAVDWWSAGCVLLEMMRGRPLFCGASTGVQLDAIAQFLGTPSVTDLKAMLQSSISGPQLAALAQPRHTQRPWADSLPAYRDNASALAIVGAILVYDPARRLSPGEALAHDFFSCLISEPALPAEIFRFSAEELSTCSASSTKKLLSWKAQNSTGSSSSSDSFSTLRRSRSVMGDECMNQGDLFPPAKRYRPFVGNAAGSSSTKLNFTFKAAACASTECHADKEIFTKVQDVPLLRAQSVSSDVSMGAEEMDVDIDNADI
eukprot:gnl/MRDRNA2_/MRDRNA2_110614_c0_seq1.p1 gnl/MRDRNA2_/MRDRNA2_110614_c0~~gnl/MRDRNA2_/MRDRNA2_110614_c0_seq1.p1  ORF type:complete len:515 (-),score=99.39 gnl/MRDRNA2_/MRDRNA2_110614_c0_seq1:206-1750(-)